MIPKPMNDFEQGDRGFASPAGCSVVALICRELFFQSVLERVTSTLRPRIAQFSVRHRVAEVGNSFI
jgi:hypothetical protein